MYDLRMFPFMGSSFNIQFIAGGVEITFIGLAFADITTGIAGCNMSDDQTVANLLKTSERERKNIDF